MPPIRIGTRMPFDGLLDSPSPRVFADDPEMRRHVGTPWLSEFLQERHGIATGPAPEATLRPFHVEGADLSMHAVLVGATSSGKTRLALHLLREQLRQGCSAVFMDVKEDTVLQAVQCARDAGFGADQVTLLWPQDRSGGMPEWNLLAGDPEEAVSLFMDAMRAVFSESWGYRLAHLLRSAATVAAAQGLSVREVVELLRDPDYAGGLLREARASGSWDAYPDPHRAFDRDYASRTASTRQEYSQPVLNKVHAFVTNAWMEALFCAERDTLDIPGLWKRPRLVAVHLDRVSLGEEGAALLATLLATYLYAVSLRRPGNVPVVLVLDELDTHERNVGRALLDILRRARQQGLRLIAATQTFSSVSPGLVSELLGNTWLRAYFNMGSADADRVAAALTTGNGTRPLRVELSPRTEGGLTQETDAAYPVLRADGSAVAVRDYAWNEARRMPSPVRAVQSLLRMSGIRDARAAGLPLEEFLRSVPDSWDSFEGPSPLRVRVRFPRPNVRTLATSTEAEQAAELSKLLQALPTRRAVVRLRNGTTGLVAIERTAFDGPLPSPSDWMASGQPRGKPGETSRRKGETIAALSVPEERPVPPKAPRAAPVPPTPPVTPTPPSAPAAAATVKPKPAPNPKPAAKPVAAPKPKPAPKKTGLPDWMAPPAAPQPPPEDDDGL